MTTAEPEIFIGDYVPTVIFPAAADPRRQTNPIARLNRAVVLQNDDENGFHFVVGVLRGVFRYSVAKAFWLTLKVHLTGRSTVWSGGLELAELKAEQIRAYGPDPARTASGAAALVVTIEPLSRRA